MLQRPDDEPTGESPWHSSLMAMPKPMHFSGADLSSVNGCSSPPLGLAWDRPQPRSLAFALTSSPSVHSPPHTSILANVNEPSLQGLFALDRDSDAFAAARAHVTGAPFNPNPTPNSPGAPAPPQPHEGTLAQQAAPSPHLSQHPRPLPTPAPLDAGAPSECVTEARATSTPAVRETSTDNDWTRPDNSSTLLNSHSLEPSTSQVPPAKKTRRESPPARPRYKALIELAQAMAEHEVDADAQREIVSKALTHAERAFRQVERIMTDAERGRSQLERQQSAVVLAANTARIDAARVEQRLERIAQVFDSKTAEAATFAAAHDSLAARQDELLAQHKLDVARMQELEGKVDEQAAALVAQRTAAEAAEAALRRDNAAAETMAASRITELEAQLASSHAERLETSEQLQKAEERVQSVAGEHAETLEALQTTRHNLQKAQAVAARVPELERLSKDHAMIVEAHATLETTLRTVSRELEMERESRVQVEARSRRALNESEQRQREQFSHASKLRADIEKLLRETQTAQEAWIQQSQEQSRQLRDRDAALGARDAELAKLATTVDIKERAIEAADSSIAALRSQLVCARDQAAQAGERATVAEGKVELGEARVQQLEEQVVTAQTERDGLRERLEQAHAQIAIAAQGHAALQDRLCAMSDRFEKAQQAVVDLESRARQRDDETSALSNRLQEVGSEAAASLESTVKARAEAERLQGQVSALESAAAEHAMELADARKRVAEAESEAAEKCNTASKAEADAARLRELVALHETREREWKSVLNESKLEFQNELRRTAAEAHVLREQIAALQRELASSTAAAEPGRAPEPPKFAQIYAKRSSELPSSDDVAPATGPEETRAETLDGEAPLAEPTAGRPAAESPKRRRGGGALASVATGPANVNLRSKRVATRHGQLGGVGRATAASVARNVSSRARPPIAAGGPSATATRSTRASAPSARPPQPRPPSGDSEDDLFRKVWHP